MSEYQRYEFMTSERPLTRAQLAAVNKLSSHIEATSTQAIIEYHWGDFKHDPIEVLYEFFDGFLYWANWGSPRLALRFPSGVLPADLLDGYDLEDFVTLIRRPKYDILDIHFGELEAPDEWVDYELSSLIPLREELMDGDLRVLYILWLASQHALGDIDEDDEDEEDWEDDEEDDDEDEDEEDWEDDEEEEEHEEQREKREKRRDKEHDEHEFIPAIPPDFNKLTAAQQALAELLQIPMPRLDAAARHSAAASSAPDDDLAAWVELLPTARRTEYLLRLARREPGLSHQLLRELRELGRDKTKAPPSGGERIPYATLLAEGQAIEHRREQEQRAKEELARQQRLQEIHDHQETYWNHVDKAVARGAASGYDEALRVLLELREAAVYFQEAQQFQARLFALVRPHLRRPAFIRRLKEHHFPLPEA